MNLTDHAMNTYRIEPRPQNPGDFDVYKNGEWVDAYPSEAAALAEVNEWRNAGAKAAL